MLQRTRAADNGRRILTFSLPLEWAGRASVVGNFNDWTPGALPLVAVDGAAEASVVLPDDYIAVFRYLGEGDHWFDEPDADHVDGGGSVVLGVEAGDPAAAEPPAEPAASAERLPSPAERSVKLIDKRRKKAEKAAEKVAAKARQKASGLAAKVAKAADKQRRAADKQRKAAERVAKENERQAKKRAKAEEAKSK